MTRVRRWPDPAPVEAAAAPTSNVIPLRPGLQVASTSAPDLQVPATRKRARKPSDNRGLQTPVSAFQVIDQADLSPLPASPSTLSVTAFRLMIESMTKMQLRERFRLEANSHRDIIARCKTGRYVLDPEFTEFRRFLWHLGPRPAPSWTVDRIDPTNPVYGPKECRWASPRTQANNRGVTVHLTARGETRPLTDWARITGQDPKTVAKRLDRGWTDEEAVAGRRGVVVPASVEAPPRPIRRSEEWPEGTKDPTGWEAAFLGFRKRFPECARPSITRAVFMGWVLTNTARHARDRLRRAFPQYEEGCDEPPAGYEDHPERLLIDKVEPRLRVVWQELGDDREQHEALSALIQAWPHVQHPAQAASLIRRENEE